MLNLNEITKAVTDKLADGEVFVSTHVYDGDIVTELHVRSEGYWLFIINCCANTEDTLAVLNHWLDKVAP